MDPLRMIRLLRMCELGELTRTCGASTPGLAKMYAIDTQDVVSIPSANALTHVISNNIILKPGKYWKDIPFVEQKSGLTDEIADAVGGGFKKNIPLKLSKYSPQTNRWVLNAIGARFIVAVADNNGQVILVGDLIAAMRLEKATGSTGQKFGDENGWDMNLTAEGVKPCYFYEGTIVLNTAITTFNTNLDFSTQTTVTSEGVTGVVGAANTHQKIGFDKITGAIGLPNDMSLYLGGVNVGVVTFKAEYIGQPGSYTHTDDVVYPFVFTNTANYPL